jgi:adenine-specific DNA-methyltransferase
LWFPLYVNDSEGTVSLTADERHTERVWPVTPDGVKTCWTWGKEKVKTENELLTASRLNDGTWRVYRKDYLNGLNGEVASTLAKSIWLDKEFNNDYGRRAIKELLGAPVMDFPKSPFLIQRIVSIASKADDIVLDFFAGSGTTGHAVMAQNVVDESRRRFILVQLPEPLNPDVKGQCAAAEFCDSLGRPRTIAEITKERLRRAGACVNAEAPLVNGDFGFRAFRLSSSNIKAWTPRSENIVESLLDQLEHVNADRSNDDVLYELLLKLGLDLCVPMQQKNIAGKAVHSIGGGVLLTCFAEQIIVADAEPLALGIVAWHKEQAPAGEVTCVFLDSAFENDVAKSNLAAILEQHGIAKVRSL